MPKPILVIAGASGVIGQHIIRVAKQAFDIRVLTREAPDTNEDNVTYVEWNPRAHKENDANGLQVVRDSMEGAKAVINLAGASIQGRFDETHKRRVLESRLDSTHTLTSALKQCQTPPQAWFQASAVGYYGDRGDEILTEDSTPQANNFLSDVAQQWEAAAMSVSEQTRMITGRFGLVLAKDASAWQLMLTPIKLFVGGPLGSGTQWYPWIHATDLANAVIYLIEHSHKGVYNFSAPHPVTQLELVKQTAARLGRPAVLPVPAFALRLALGGLADNLVLPSARMLPKRLLKTGFVFEFPEFSQALDVLL